MVRTKVSSSYEGGVLPGFGVVDTVYLTWWSQDHFNSKYYECFTCITISFFTPDCVCFSPKTVKEEKMHCCIF